MSYYTSPYDVIYLPFDDYAGQDICGNYWNVYNLQVGTTHAKEGKAAQLSAGPNMSLRDGITLGGQDFTIDAWIYADSSTSSYGRFFECNNGTASQRAELAREATNSRLYFFFLADSNPFYTPYNMMNTLFHWAFVYDHSAGESTMYINGQSCGTRSQTISRQSFPNFNIGYSYYDQSAKAIGAVDCFRVADGLARWSSDFTPPSLYLLEDVTLSADTARKLQNVETISVDTRRKIRLGEAVTINADTNRRLCESTTISADTRRRVFDNTTLVEVAADTKRQVVHSTTINADTKRTLQESTVILADTARKLPHNVAVSEGNLQSVEINIEPQQVTDRVAIAINGTYDIMDYVAGSYLDYNYTLCVESTSKRGIIQQCQCTTSLDELLYQEIWYELQGTTYKDNEKPMALASSHVSRIANSLGLSVVSRYDDFVSTMDCEQKNVSYRDLIINLFGWSSRIPQRLINSYIRGNTLYIIQRGKEGNVIDITNLKRTMPTINREIVRIAYGSSLTNTKVERIPGVWWTRLVQPLQDTEDTHYEYFLGLLRTKTTNNNDGTTTVTTYEYDESYANNHKYLARELEITSKSSGTFEEISRRETIHTPLRNGQMETRVYVDGELEGSTVSKGTSNDIPSEYIVREETITLVEPEDKETILPGRALIDTSFPINDRNTLISVTDAIKWLNRRVKETVSMEIYDYNHVIDYNDRIILDGTTYYLESNVVQKSPRVNNMQAITLVRWF